MPRRRDNDAARSNAQQPPSSEDSSEGARDKRGSTSDSASTDSQDSRACLPDESQSAWSQSEVSQSGSASRRRPSSYGESTNLSLIDRVRAQDSESWRVFMDIYRPLVSYWCRRANLQGADVEDVCQDVFQAVSKSIKRFRKTRPTDTFRGWLRTITRARIADFIRRDMSQPKATGAGDSWLFVKPAEGVMDEHDDDDDSDPGEREASMEVFQRALEMVKSTVEEHTWRAFWRTTVDDQPTADVADELGMTKDAVRKAKSRMGIRLRLELGPLLDEITRSAGVNLSSNDAS